MQISNFSSILDRSVVRVIPASGSENESGAFYFPGPVAAPR